MLKQAAEELALTLGVRAACEMVGLPRSSYYRTRPSDTPRAARALPARSLSADERATIRTLLNSDRFADCAPREVYASLLDEGIYHCSWRTMYRILAASDEVRERRDQARRQVYSKPELLATGPNQLWSWDITKLKGPVEWTYYYLYVILDVFSRYVVGWMVMEVESSELAEAFIAETCSKQGIKPNQLTIHADRGSAMTSKCVAQLLVDLQVRKTHSRPHVSNDNPFSESQFKTLKYRPGYPVRFGSLEDARAWARPFFQWYNNEHHHTGLNLLTPAMVHHGLAEQVLLARQQVLDTAYELHPERFVRRAPQAGKVPEAVWINPPTAASAPSEGADGVGGSLPTPAGSCPHPDVGKQERLGAEGCGQVEAGRRRRVGRAVTEAVP